MPIDFYTNPMSRGQIARWMLEEVGADYTEHLLDYGTTMKSPGHIWRSTRWARCRRSSMPGRW